MGKRSAHLLMCRWSRKEGHFKCCTSSALPDDMGIGDRARPASVFKVSPAYGDVKFVHFLVVYPSFVYPFAKQAVHWGPFIYQGPLIKLHFRRENLQIRLVLRPGLLQSFSLLVNSIMTAFCMNIWAALDSTILTQRDQKYMRHMHTFQ